MAADWRSLHTSGAPADVEGQVPVHQAITACLGQAAVHLTVRCAFPESDVLELLSKINRFQMGCFGGRGHL